MSRAEPLTITLIEVDDLEDVLLAYYDPLLYPAFMLMSASLVEAASQRTGEGVERTSPLRFSFTERTFIFRKQPTQPGITTLLREQLLPSSDGVIVNLRDSIPSVSNTSALLLKEMLQAVSEWSGPTVFSTKRASLEVSNSGETAESYFQPWPRVIQSIRENFPKVVPIIGYDYSRPGSLKKILTTLLAEIDKVQHKAWVGFQAGLAKPSAEALRKMGPLADLILTQFDWSTLDSTVLKQLEPAVIALREGRKSDCLLHLSSILQDDPGCEIAWLLQLAATDDKTQQRRVLQRVLEINPASEIGQKMKWLILEPSERMISRWSRENLDELLWEEFSWATVKPSLAKTLEPMLIALKRKEKLKAKKALIEILREDRTNEVAWLWLASLLDDPAKQLDCVQRVLALDPKNELGQKMLILIKSSAEEEG